MTCVVAVVDGAECVLAADSRMSLSGGIHCMIDSKIFEIGSTGVVAAIAGDIQCLASLKILKVPAPKASQSAEHWCTAVFWPACVKALQKADVAYKDGVSDLILVVRGEPIYVDLDGTITCVADGYAAIGCGAPVAFGSLYTTRGYADAEARAFDAVAAACHHCEAVGPPIKIRRCG